MFPVLVIMLTVAAPVDSKSVLSQIRQEGPRAVLLRANDDSAFWSVITHGVSSAKKEWLEVARLLKPAADGGLSLDLTLALGSALTKAPEYVLRMTGPDLDTTDVCGFFVQHRAQSRESALRALRDQENAVRKVASPQLQYARATCLQSISAARDYAEGALR